jgi:hypothetical protein
MKLKKFIKILKKIEREHGENLELVMADNIPVVEPLFLDNLVGRKVVVITDQK